MNKSFFSLYLIVANRAHLAIKFEIHDLLVSSLFFFGNFESVLRFFWAGLEPSTNLIGQAAVVDSTFPFASVDYI